MKVQTFIKHPSKRENLLRVGVIGTGAFAEQCHLPELQSHPRARVVALSGSRPERLRYLANRFSIPDVHTDYRELCARSDLDAITIASSNHEHAAQALAALFSGKHVFCEKPLGTSVAQARRMVHGAELSGKLHQVGFTYRYLYGVQELRRRVHRGDIGVPFHVRSHWNSWEALVPSSLPEHRSRRRLNAAGILHDVGPHLFDLARFLFGPIQTVMGKVSNISHRRIGNPSDEATIQSDDIATAWFSHAQGIQGQWFASRVMPAFGEKSHIEVVGNEGALRASLSRGSVDVLRLARPSKVGWEELPLPEEAYDNSPSCLRIMMHSFVDACLGHSANEHVNPSFHDGLAAQLAIEAVEQSALCLPWVPIQETIDAKTNLSNSFFRKKPNAGDTTNCRSISSPTGTSTIIPWVVQI